MSSREFDVIIFGATGFTGNLVAQYMARNQTQKGKQVKWAIAGRSKDRLEKVLSALPGDATKSVAIVIADVADEKSLNAMAARTKVIINTTGPFELYGEAVVKAAIKNGTHHLDSSGEPGYALTLYNKYNEKAKESGSIIVPCCGFDSIPADLTTFVAMSKIPQDKLDVVDVEVEVHHLPDIVPSAGTYRTIVEGMSKSLSELGKQQNVAHFKSHPHKYKDWGYAVPLPSSDQAVVLQSAKILRQGNLASHQVPYPVNFHSSVFLTVR